MSKKTELRAFSYYLEALAHAHSRHTVFDDFLTMIVCSLSMGKKEDEYLRTVKKYTKEEINIFCEAYASLVMQMTNDPLNDPFGGYFEEYLYNGKNGQFFTPQSVSDLMAQITCKCETKFIEIISLNGHEATEAIHLLNNNGEEDAVEYLSQWDAERDGEEVTRENFGSASTVSKVGDYVLVYNKQIDSISLYIECKKKKESVCDPTCGSGRLFLSVAKIDRNKYFIGADISLTCCKMTLINMCLNSLEGEVCHMDSLSLEVWQKWFVIVDPLLRIPCIYEVEETPEANNQTPIQVSIETKNGEAKIKEEISPIVASNNKSKGFIKYKASV